MGLLSGNTASLKKWHGFLKKFHFVKLSDLFDVEILRDVFSHQLSQGASLRHGASRKPKHKTNHQNAHARRSVLKHSFENPNRRGKQHDVSIRNKI